MNIAVITGASSGLGREYVRQLVAQVPSLDEIWLIARRLDRLEALAAEFPETAFRCLPLDLTDPQSFTIYQAALQEANATVKVLINNAGFGKLGLFAEEEVTAQVGMVDLNCRALTAITNLTLPYMQQGSGVLNVSSIASYAPTPRMAVYCSTKAYVSSFSHALAEELRPRGITVLAVCPGPMATEFLEVAAITGRSKTFQTLPYCKPEAVAKHSLKRLLRGKRWYTNLVFYKFYRVLCKLLPFRFIMKLSKT
ncbi:MAG: SDR family NAD(P)-dependent oxidoreductase [Clostridia bacterium]|nr:SDR family NAD(P)-dependent oxidoreductase [Clostridia bacterium]